MPKENSDCIFCKIINKKVKSEIVYNDDNFLGILDANPRAEGHTLVISKTHYKTMLDLPSSLGTELLDAIKKVSLDLIDQGKGEGVNVLSNVGKSSGQVISHIHVHIIPRKNGDGLRVIS
mgnify:FL=1